MPVTGLHDSLSDAAFLSQKIGEFSDSSGFVEDLAFNKAKPAYVQIFDHDRVKSSDQIWGL